MMSKLIRQMRKYITYTNLFHVEYYIYYMLAYGGIHIMNHPQY